MELTNLVGLVRAFPTRHLLVEDGDEDAHYCVGPGACLAGDWHTIDEDDRKRGLVPVLYSPNDVLWYLDASGRAWGYDSIEGPGPTPYARDGDMLIARVLLYGRLFDYEAKEMLDRFAGEELAKRLGVGPIATATDELARWWGDGEVLIVEPPDDEYLSGMRDAPAPRTTIGSSNADRLRGII